MENRPSAPNKKFAALLYLPLTIPGLIPMYFAFQQEDTSMFIGMMALGLAVLVFNALLLVTLYRWLVRTMS